MSDKPQPQNSQIAAQMQQFFLLSNIVSTSPIQLKVATIIFLINKTLSLLSSVKIIPLRITVVTEIVSLHFPGFFPYGW